MAFDRLTRFYRSCLLQIIIVGLVAFCEPGIWTALNNLGAGGNAKPYLNNAANALTYGLMSVGCFLAGGVTNKITAKWTLFIGAAFYTPYAAGLYCNNRYGNEWFLLLGAALCGIGASLLWASEAAIAVGYPEEEKRGRYVAIWMSIRQMGPLVGGAISLALNVNTAHVGKVTYTTYLGLVAISSLGAPFALLLSQPQNVIRSNGTKIPYMKKTSLAIEARAIWKQLSNKYMLLLIPVFLAGQFGVTYQGNYLTTYFTVRSRALASFLTAVVGATANVVTGIFLDLKFFSRGTRSKIVYIFVLVFITAAWTWNAITETKLSRMAEPPAFDLGDGPFFNSAFTVYIFFRFFYEVLQTYIYWLMAEIKGAQADGDIARTTGILRSWESIGSTIAYAVGATHWANLNQMILGFALWGFTIPFTLLAVFGDWNVSDTLEVEEETDNSSLEAQRVVINSDGKD
ncbi:Major facilitator superfamily domain general substrate transporter [Penicillium concentricum]|uniref:Major facilitator superfamily domain general substrate transporter n=1 Tax=Penicillium concentricum TaxID=293559 RepID=A0A9W9SWF6_9EURO|nr:Major facilitator superfamily domain general substrate transporter [Penicillium concentricum]KAJ5385034.1 Major facilitator superfamily domain general substrate transporter [Penicillium concentricum]